MSSVCKVINNINEAQRQREAALDAFERAERVGDAISCHDAEQAIRASYEAERDAYQALARMAAVDYVETILKASVLINATTAENLGEPIWEDELPALMASIERDMAAFGVR
jgi:hypothetical protein